jgi:hypothetical protein
MATRDASRMVISYPKDELALVPGRPGENRPHAAHAEARGAHSGRGDEVGGCDAQDPRDIWRTRMRDLPNCGHAYRLDTAEQCAHGEVQLHRFHPALSSLCRRCRYQHDEESLCWVHAKRAAGRRTRAESVMLEVDALREPFAAAGRVCDLATTHLLECRGPCAKGGKVLDIVDAELTFVGASKHDMVFVQKLKRGLLRSGQLEARVGIDAKRDRNTDSQTRIHERHASSPMHRYTILDPRRQRRGPHRRGKNPGGSSNHREETLCPHGLPPDVLLPSKVFSRGNCCR